MKIVVGGQMDKQKIADIAQNLGGDAATVAVMGDIQAAMEVKSGQADIYLGSCNTGGGGALSMAIALLGADKCVTLSMPGAIKSDEEIAVEVQAGKKAFGFTTQDIEAVVPALMKSLLEAK